MARTSLTLCVSFTPAYAALIDVAQAIAERDGEDRAMAFVQSALQSDQDAFIAMRAESPRPVLRLVHSAA